MGKIAIKGDYFQQAPAVLTIDFPRMPGKGTTFLEKRSCCRPGALTRPLIKLPFGSADAITRHEVLKRRHLSRQSIIRG